MKLPKFVGKIIYIFSYPFICIFLQGTLRVYVVIRFKNKILLTKNWLGLQHNWRLPGGGVKHDEDIFIAAKREIAEELGINLSGLQISPLTSQAQKARRGFKYQILMVVLAAEPVINQSVAISHTKFFNENKIKELALNESTKFAIDKINWDK